MSEGFIFKEQRPRRFLSRTLPLFHVLERFTSYSEESALFLKQIATVSNPKPFKNLAHYYPWPGNQS